MGITKPKGISTWFGIGGLCWTALAGAGCVKQTQDKTQAPQFSQASELLELRRENAALRQELELAKDQELMCMRASSDAPARVDQAPVKLVPEAQTVASSAGPSRPRGVSLQDLPHSAPDQEVMARYSASAAPEAGGQGEPDPKQYRLVGAKSKPRTSTKRRGPAIELRTPDTPQALPESRPSAQELYRKARALYQKGERGAARVLFAQIESDYPQSDLADNAAYWQAEADKDAGALDKAQAGFMRVLSDYPSGNKVEDAMYMLGLCFQEQAQFDRARAMFAKVAKAGRRELRKKAKSALRRLPDVGSTESMNGR